MDTATLRNQQYRFSVHLAKRLDERNIPVELVKVAIKQGKPWTPKDSAVGKTYGFRLGAFKVVVGFFGAQANILTAFWDDNITGGTNGSTPPRHLIEKFLTM